MAARALPVAFVLLAAPAGAQTIEGWLTIEPLTSSAPSMFRVDEVFARHLLDQDAEPPKEGATVGSPGRERRWVTKQTGADGFIAGPADYVYSEFRSDTDRILLARLPGAATLYVNGAPFTGDPERRGYEGVPVAVRAGTNRLFVHGVGTSFRLELIAPPASVVLTNRGLPTPAVELRDDNYFDDQLPLRVINASLRPAPCVHLHFSHIQNEPSDDAGPPIAEWDDSMSLPPLGVGWISLPVSTPDWEPLIEGPSSFPMAVEAWTDDEALKARAVFEIPTPGYLETSEFDPHFPRRAVLREHTPASWWHDFAVERPARFQPESASLYVCGTAGNDEEDRELVARSRYDHARRSELGFATAAWSTDVDALGERTGAVVALYGNADTNSMWRVLVPGSSPVRVRRGCLELGEHRFDGDDLSVIALLPSTIDGCSVILFGDTSAKATRLGCALDVFAQDGAWPDVLVYSSEVLSRGADGVLAVARVAGKELAAVRLRGEPPPAVK